MAKWEEASKACRTLDAKLTILRYRVVFNGAQPDITHGRFYYEAPDFARYDVDDVGHRHEGNGPHSFVWSAEGLFLIDHRVKTCSFFSSQTMATARKRIEQMPEQTWWDRFWKGYISFFTWPALVSTPDDLMPLFLNTNTLRQRQRFDFQVVDSEGRLVVLATPRQKNSRFRDVHVMLDKNSYQLVAHRLIGVARDETVHVFDDLKINSPPADRDALKKPVPAGYRVVHADDLISGG